MSQVLPPVPDRRPRETVVHGHPLADDFAWLKAENWQEVLKDPAALPADIRAYLEAENAYAAAITGHLASLEDVLFAEMRGRIKEDDSTVPQPDGAFSYYTRHRGGGQHPLACRRPRDGGTETLLLDGDALAQGKPFYQLGPRAHTDDHRLLAWSCDEKGSEYFSIRVRDMHTLADLDDLVPDTTGHVVWDAEGQSFLYVAVDDNHRPRTVRRHVLGTPVGQDAVIYDEPDPGWFVGLDTVRSPRFAFITTGDHETSETRVLDRANLSAAPRLLAARETGVRYEVDHQGDRFVILTNADGAEDFKVVTAPLTSTSRAEWRDLVPHRPGILLLSLQAFSGHLARLEREDARPRIIVTRVSDGTEHAIAFDEEAYSLGMPGGFEYDTRVLRFVYSSMTTPTETWDYDMEDRTRVLLKRQEIPSGHDPAAYRTRRIMARSHDGELVPVSVLHRAGLTPDGSHPVLLYGYGAYGYAMPAGFDTKALSLVDRGFVYAIAHVRGGTEKGWGWYKNGKREKKQNTFKDFVAAAQALCEQGYTRPGRIVAQGRSAGGMLMGAVANMAPDLFAAILAEVPFVDVLNTMLDGTLPLTPPEWPEWGNPGASAADFETILAYSPYDRVMPRRYPPVLAVGGLTDPRVTYWEPAKWIARLRATARGGPFLLRTEMDAGHGGASGRFDRLREVARSYAFAVAVAEGRLAA
jgi:oligopeptidase B